MSGMYCYWIELSHLCEHFRYGVVLQVVSDQIYMLPDRTYLWTYIIT